MGAESSPSSVAAIVAATVPSSPRPSVIEWTRKKFDEGKYKSSDIYSTPRDPALKKEYDEYLKKRLEEIRRKQ